MKKTLKVVYETDGEPNYDLDEALTKAAERFGFIFYARGMDLITKVRDIAFDKDV